jgi:prevent-host-death family protein
MTIMAKMAKSARASASAEKVSVATAKNHLSELLGRVAYGGETVLITRRGRPMAKLVPPDFVAPGDGLADVKGWVDDDHPFLAAVNDIVAARRKHLPRAMKRRRGR